MAAQTDYLKARSAEAQADRALARQKDLVEHGIGAKRDLEQAGTERELAHSELERAATRLRLLGMDPGQVGRPLQVRAPVSVLPGQRAQRTHRCTHRPGFAALRFRENPTMAGPQLSVPIELGGKRHSRVAVAQSALAAGGCDYEDATRTLRGLAADAFVDALHARLVVARKESALSHLQRQAAGLKEDLLKL